MPRSDTWPGGVAMETMTGMDSAGSCDSVVSMNSGSSDDSLEHLSAEEKACLMFLEETIESLDTEEDSGLSNDEPDHSGLSNDEPDHLPTSGNVANRMACLSSSVDNSQMNSVSKQPCEQPIREDSKERRPAYLVATPLVRANANGSSSLPPRSRSDPTPDKENSRPGPETPPSEPRPRPGHPPPRVPSEVNVVVIPPPTKPRDPERRCWGSEGPGPRGPLSYEALVQLRKSASMKRAPESPAPGPAGAMKAQPSSLPRGPPSGTRPHPQVPGSYHPSPPVVAPKPKRMPSNVSLKPQGGVAAGSPPRLDSSPGDRPLSDPQRVRQEALQKLGLLREHGPEPMPAASTGPSKYHSPWDAPPRGLPTDPALSIPGQGQPFSYTQIPGGPHTKPRPTQGSGLPLRHHTSRSQQPVTPPSHLARAGEVRPATLERCGVGLGSRVAEQTAHSAPQPRSASLGNQRREGCGAPAVPSRAPETAPLARPAPQKAAHPEGFSVAAVPTMAADRREALRKLGLLKN